MNGEWNDILMNLDFYMLTWLIWLIFKSMIFFILVFNGIGVWMVVNNHQLLDFNGT